MYSCIICIRGSHVCYQRVVIYMLVLLRVCVCVRTRVCVHVHACVSLRQFHQAIRQHSWTKQMFKHIYHNSLVTDVRTPYAYECCHFSRWQLCLCSSRACIVSFSSFTGIMNMAGAIPGMSMCTDILLACAEAWCKFRGIGQDTESN